MCAQRVGEKGRWWQQFELAHALFWNQQSDLMFDGDGTDWVIIGFTGSTVDGLSTGGTTDACLVI